MLLKSTEKWFSSQNNVFPIEVEVLEVTFFIMPFFERGDPRNLLVVLNPTNTSITINTYNNHRYRGERNKSSRF